MLQKELTADECLELFKKYDSKVYEYYSCHPYFFNQKAREYAEYLKEQMSGESKIPGEASSHFLKHIQIINEINTKVQRMRIPESERTERRKCAAKVLAIFSEFFMAVEDCVKFCKNNNFSISFWHEIDGIDHQISCNENGFSVSVKAEKSRSILTTTRFLYIPGFLTRSLVGNNPTIDSITRDDGSLTDGAKWFERNAYTILELVNMKLEGVYLNLLHEDLFEREEEECQR